jgi:hypothetical protein
MAPTEYDMENMLKPRAIKHSVIVGCVLPRKIIEKEIKSHEKTLKINILERFFITYGLL